LRLLDGVPVPGVASAIRVSLTRQPCAILQ
jgi:hypothetical protein